MRARHRFPWAHLLGLALLAGACGAPPVPEPMVEVPEPATPAPLGLPQRPVVQVLVPPVPARPSISFVLPRDGATTEVDTIVYGERMHFVLRGMPAGQTVRLLTRTHDLSSATLGWESSAVFQVPASGVVDVSGEPSLSGSYEGIEPEGPVWSMVRVSRPPGLGPDPYALYVSVESEDEEVLASAALPRLATAPGVQRIVVNDDGLYGVLYLPASATKRSPVITFGGSEGGLYGGEWFAASAAAWGHPALGLAYFGAPGLPQELKNVPVEYFEKAVAWLKQRSDLDTSRIAVMGASRGGELALLLGATIPEVTAVVAWAPSGYAWGAVAAVPGAAWTYQGVALPPVPSSPSAQPAVVTGPDGSDAYALSPMFLKDLIDASASAVTAATIPVENIRGPLLMLSGEDDFLWPSCYFQSKVMQRLRAASPVERQGDEAHCFPDAGHNLPFVGGPTTSAMWMRLQANGPWYALGGSARGIAHAQREADTRAREFLQRALNP